MVCVCDSAFTLHCCDTLSNSVGRLPSFSPLVLINGTSRQAEDANTDLQAAQIGSVEAMGYPMYSTERLAARCAAYILASSLGRLLANRR